VRDNGIGIAPEQLPRIFDLYSQSKDENERSGRDGLGIGLTLVKDIVEMHGGRVKAFSTGRNQGSEFLVQLPLNSTESDRRREIFFRRRSAGMPC